MAMLRSVLRAAPWRQTATSTTFVRSMSAGVNKLALIKDLRERTGAPISDVKAVLEISNWDIEEASKELRKKGLAAASKKSSRHAAEGLVAFGRTPSGGAVAAEVNSETDFVARNPQFQSLVTSVAEAIAAASSAAATSGRLPTGATAVSHEEALAALAEGGTVGEAVANLAGTVRENIAFRRAHSLSSGPGGAVGTYVHAAASPGGPGRIAAAVALSPVSGDAAAADQAAARLAELAAQLAMHVAAAAPKFLSRAEVDASALEAERELLTAQAAGSGKPAAIVAKMVEGRLGKYYGENCLLEQQYVIDDSKRVRDVVKDLGKQLGVELQVDGFLRIQVGEGIEARETKDFASEVADTLKATSQ